MFKLGVTWNVLTSDLTSLAECDIMEVTVNDAKVAIEDIATMETVLDNMEARSSSGIHFKVTGIANATWSLEVIKEASAT